MNLRPATRQGVRPLIGLFAESGCGKTYSALLLARGLAGKGGSIGMIDTESGRGELYADVIPGGYQVLPLTEPFNPDRYIEAIEAVEASGAAVGIVDSASHEWEGAGGVLDAAADIEDKSGKTGLHCWRKPKFEHAKFVARLLRAKIPWIVCLRAKFKSRQKKEGGRTVILKDEFTTPIQAEDFIFEMTVHGEIMPDHSFRLTKCSHPELAKCFPVDAPVTVENGEALARWCAKGTVGADSDRPKQPTATTSTAPTLDELKRTLWNISQHIHEGDKETLQTWLRAKKLLAENKKLSDMSAAQIADAIASIEGEL